jgi:hypothetical protein
VVELANDAGVGVIPHVERHRCPCSDSRGQRSAGSLQAKVHAPFIVDLRTRLAHLTGKPDYRVAHQVPCSICSHLHPLRGLVPHDPGTKPRYHAC